MNLSLIDKTAMVCGSTRGIGRATAEALANAGARVVLVARDETALQTVCDGLSRQHGQEHHRISVDFKETEQLQKKVADVRTEVGTVHILVNNTGGPPGGLALEADVNEYETAFRQHLIANHLLVQAVTPGMKQAGYGRIINIISTSVKQPIPGLGVSNTVRGAVANWAKTLAGELAPFGITVNNVLPGATETARLQTIIQAKAQKAGLSIPEIERNMLSRIPLGRFAEASEIAAAVVFLASPAASYITGINLPVDGGRTACL